MSHLLYGLRGEDVLSMDDDGVLPELRRVILVKPVIVACEVALLRDPELDGVVLRLDEVQPRGPDQGDQQRDQDNWHRMGGGPDTEPEGEQNIKSRNIKT